MNGSWFGVLDMAIVGVPAILFVIWQLVSVNREIRRDREKAAQAKDDSPEGARHPVGEHSLDDR
ncbi:hypothetical protein U1872_16425 [Sphingomonas sp. RB3P16]|uniref:hypothetical protein n=1 Tax=Parasphingomonas frigoris TaxID=3096163 RepID=UPI002FC7A94D